MSIDRSRRVVFEEVADLYQETRPSYPEELVEDVIRWSGLGENGRILEIGCGPGNATLCLPGAAIPCWVLNWAKNWRNMPGNAAPLLPTPSSCSRPLRIMNCRHTVSTWQFRPMPFTGFSRKLVIPNC